MRKFNCFKLLFLFTVFLLKTSYGYSSEKKFIVFQGADNLLPIIESGIPMPVMLDKGVDSAVEIAAQSLLQDFERVCGKQSNFINNDTDKAAQLIIVGTVGTPIIDKLIKEKKINGKELKGKHEKFFIQNIKNPVAGVDEALVIAGSDRRGTVYGIYELSKQMGVSPWYWWMDVPVVHQDNVYFVPGTYTDGEPVVKYRGLFLNDEAPCLTTWVKNNYGTRRGGHEFYADVFELILRLKGNYLWPAMWSWAFYADDELNSDTAHKMGVLMGTSHHEPMARNHQEWARKRKEYGVWDYSVNQKTIDTFFEEGIRRVADKEDIITIGMRGDGDTPMGGKEGEDDKYVPKDEENIALLENIIKNQRNIIKEVTGKAPNKRTQVWALYKEVQKYYDMGLRVPDDVIILLSDDNWGNIRRLPNEEERKHPGGWGIYYHVDYVGAPRSTKWINVTPIQNMWEQLDLAYSYGVDKLWILNVGDLKPMEYPISLFMDMAWNPDQFNADNLLDHARSFCAQQFGEDQADEAARILNLYSKYNGRVTPEMLDAKTYNLETGEWKQVADEYTKLEAEALRQYLTLPEEYRDAYQQLLLFPVQAMSNLYEMYYSQAMNHKLYGVGDIAANYWADQVEQCFERDQALNRAYNKDIANGKWDGMMIQKHISYKTWNDNFEADVVPDVYRVDAQEYVPGGYMFENKDGVVSIEAEHFYTKNDAASGAAWTVIPYMGRTLSGVSLMPRTEPVDGASLSYKMKLPKDLTQVKVIVVVKSTLAFHKSTGHEYVVGFDAANSKKINFNNNLNEDPKNVYSVFYPTVARRVVEKSVNLKLPETTDDYHTLTITPLDPGIVFEKIVVDCGGYKKSYLHMTESPYTIQKNNDKNFNAINTLD